MRRLSLLLLACTAILLSLLPAPFATAASCNIETARYELESDVVEWKMKIPSGENCIQGLRTKAVSLDFVQISAQPQFGQLMLQGPGFYYQANPNYKGADSFEIEVFGLKGRNRGSSTVRVNVSVN